MFFTDCIKQQIALIETALTGDTLYLKTLWGQHIKLNHADTNLEFHAYTKPQPY